MFIQVLEFYRQHPGQAAQAAGPNVPFMLAAAAAGLLVLAALVFLLLRGRLGKQRPGSAPAPDASAGQTPGAGTGGWLVTADGRQAAISSLPLSIGATDASQVVLAGPAVAPQHARLYLDDLENVLCIEDLSGGNNLLLVNGRPTRKNLIKDQDEITLGGVVLHYHAAPPPAPADIRGEQHAES